MTFCNRSMMRIAGLVVLLLAVAIGVNAHDPATTEHPPCFDCHACNTPTAEKPCLKNCMRQTRSAHPVSTSVQGPNMIVLGTSSGEYAPVSFDHQTHVTMGEMGEGCSACHHFTSKTAILPCRECHTEPQALGQPGLKGAYHRQCLGCHSEWSHSNACDNCHEEGSTIIEAAALQMEDPFGVVTEPATIIYEISYKPGEKVTFHHEEHSGTYDLKCTKCHHQEECRYCHDKQQSNFMKRSEEEIHAICTDCHDTDNCDKCHGEEEKPPFTHDAAHWKLGPYHRHLECKTCHQTGARISGLSTDCNSCHSDWSSDNFNHTATGFALDEFHVDLDCEDCHVDRQFHDGPDCTDCHDDARTQESNPPGIRRTTSSIPVSSTTGN